jgi:hypothetical protein
MRHTGWCYFAIVIEVIRVEVIIEIVAVHTVVHTVVHPVTAPNLRIPGLRIPGLGVETVVHTVLRVGTIEIVHPATTEIVHSATRAWHHVAAAIVNVAKGIIVVAMINAAKRFSVWRRAIVAAVRSVARISRLIVRSRSSTIINVIDVIIIHYIDIVIHNIMIRNVVITDIVIIDDVNVGHSAGVSARLYSAEVSRTWAGRAESTSASCIRVSRVLLVGRQISMWRVAVRSRSV